MPHATASDGVKLYYEETGAGTPQTLDPSATDTQPGTNNGSPCADGDGYDCAILQFSFLVPSGMHSIKFRFNFMSAEYPEFEGLEEAAAEPAGPQETAQ